MSGGAFDYIEKRIENDLLVSLDDLLKNNNYSIETNIRIKKCYNLLYSSIPLLKNIDYLLCGDISENTFLERTKEKDDN